MADLKLLPNENALNHNSNPVLAPQLGNATNKPSIYILGADSGTKQSVMTCNTSKGFPSFFMIYLEDFGNDYYDQNFNNSTLYDVGTDMIVGSHPQIYELEIRVFGQSFPITKQLSYQELEYLTKKNCHPRCNFKDNMNLDPIVLLKLEDLGLATENVGYPSNKRLEMEIHIKQLALPVHWNLRYASFTQNPAAGPVPAYKTDLQPAPPMRAYAAFVYENHVLEGNNNRLDFVWK